MTTVKAAAKVNHVPAKAKAKANTVPAKAKVVTRVIANDNITRLTSMVAVNQAKAQKAVLDTAAAQMMRVPATVRELAKGIKLPSTPVSGTCTWLGHVQNAKNSNLDRLLYQAITDIKAGNDLNVTRLTGTLLDGTCSLGYIKSNDIAALAKKVKAHMCRTVTGNQWLLSKAWQGRKAVATLPAATRQSIDSIAYIGDTVGRAVVGALIFKAKSA